MGHWLRAAGLVVGAQSLIDPGESHSAPILLALVA
jgi:hypothetical protein